MTYRGLDMDLRTPGARPSARREQMPAGEGFGTLSHWDRDGGARGSEPLWVDETVLACCNHAYDLALAHGAPTVRLDHLLHAMTRVDAAAQALERRGVREAQLRRESSALIASEAPITIGAERGAPRRSEELEDVLVHAVALADRRGDAATVEDVLAVMLGYARELPAIVLLRAATPEWSRLDRPRVRERVAVRSEPRVERPRSEPRLEPVVVHAMTEPRFETIESALRTIRAELASDRKAITDLVRDIHRDTNDQLQRLERLIDVRIGDVHALPAAVAQRVEGVEAAIEGRMAALDRLWSATGDRIEDVVDGRVRDLERVWALTGERVDNVQTTLDERLERPVGMLGELRERIAGIELAVNQPPAPDAETVQLIDRVQSLERAVHGGMSEGARNWAGLAHRLQGFEVAIARIAEIEREMKARSGESAGALALFTEKLTSLEGAVRAVDGAAGINQLWPAIGQRLQTLERMIETRASEHTSQSRVLADRLKTLEDMLASQRAEQAETRAAFAVGLKTLESNGHVAGIDVEAVQRGLGDRLGIIRQDLEQAIGSRQAELQARLAALERALEGALKDGRERHDATLTDLMDMQEALIRLADNQQALASSLKDWRLDTQGDLSIINNQLAELIALPRVAAPAPVAAPVQPRASTPVVATAPAAPTSGAPAPTAIAAATAQVNGTTHGSATERIERPAPAAPTPPAPPRSQPVAPVVAENETPVLRSGTAELETSVPNGHGAGFWWWLFGTGNVKQANRNVDLRWQRVRERMRTRQDRADRA